MPEFFLYIKDKKIVNTTVVREKFTALEDGRYKVTIKKSKTRSLNQNDYYWKCVVPMVKDGLVDAGFDDVKTKEDAHEILKHLFLKKRFYNKESGEEIILSGTTTTLSTIEFNGLLEEIWRWAASYLSITIPSPNQQVEIFQKEVP